MILRCDRTAKQTKLKEMKIGSIVPVEDFKKMIQIKDADLVSLNIAVPILRIFATMVPYE